MIGPGPSPRQPSQRRPYITIGVSMKGLDGWASDKKRALDRDIMNRVKEFSVAALELARDLSSAAPHLTQKQLDDMDNPYARRHGGRGLPKPAYMIHRQTGTYYKGWKRHLGHNPYSGHFLLIRNYDPKAKALEYGLSTKSGQKGRMIPRPLLRHLMQMLKPVIRDIIGRRNARLYKWGNLD